MSGWLPPAPFLYPIVDAGVLGGRSPAAVVTALAGAGARLLQFRAKGLADGRFVQLARECLAAARAAGAGLVVNDRPDVALILGADGVHVGQDDLEAADVRRLLPSALIGLSTHTLDQVRRAAGQPLDYVAFGPVFPTRSKLAPDPVVGPDLVRQARALTDRPLVAIGGITRLNAAAVLAAGADGLAVISDLLAAGDPATAVREFQVLLAPRHGV